MTRAFAVVDLFAGAGGLGEGFASFRDGAGRQRYRLEMSVERDPAACETLRLRGFLRQFRGGFPDDYYSFLNGEAPEPEWAIRFPRRWERASREVVCRELGPRGGTRALFGRMEDIRSRYGGDTVLIGGPPCQAYSLVGRGRNAGRGDYDPDTDTRLVLYREFARVLRTLNPAAFVMENVKGILSASRWGRPVFQDVVGQLESAGSGYKLFPLSPRAHELDARDPKRFIVRAEDHGIPQARHRVILVGLRSDVVSARGGSLLNLQDLTPCATSGVLTGMPRQRSRLSRGFDSPALWSKTVCDAAAEITSWSHRLRNGAGTRLARAIEDAVSGMNGSPPDWRRRSIRVGKGCPAESAALASGRPARTPPQQRNPRPHALRSRSLSLRLRMGHGDGPHTRSVRLSGVPATGPPQLGQESFLGPIPRSGPKRAVEHDHQSHRKGRPLLHSPRSSTVPQLHGAGGCSPADLPRQLHLQGESEPAVCSGGERGTAISWRSRSRIGCGGRSPAAGLRDRCARTRRRVWGCGTGGTCEPSESHRARRR